MQKPKHALAGILAVLVLAGLMAAAPSVPASADSVLDRARDAVREAGRKIDQAAKDAGRSVRDFLTDNPDLNRDILDFGQQVGVPGFEGAKPQAGPGITLSMPAGVPGAEVTIAAIGLPGDMDVAVGARPATGGAPDSYQLLAHGHTDNRGVLFVTVRVPDAKPGSEVVFLVETADLRVRLASEPLKVLPPAAAITVTGTLSKEGVECPALRGDDGKLYTLTPRELGAFGPGDRIVVKGAVAEVSTCMQGITIVVSSIAAAN